MGVITRIVLYCDKGCGRTIEYIDDATRKQTEANAQKAGWSCTGVGHICPDYVEAAKGMLHVAEIRVTFHPADSGTYPNGMTWHTPAGHTYAFFQEGRKRVGGTYNNPSEPPGSALVARRLRGVHPLRSLWDKRRTQAYPSSVVTEMRRSVKYVYEVRAEEIVQRTYTVVAVDPTHAIELMTSNHWEESEVTDTCFQRVTEVREIRKMTSHQDSL